MKIKVELFSRLRDAAPGLDGSVIELPREASVSDLLRNLFTKHPALEVWDKRMLVAISLEWATRDQILRDGDVVSLMPPVQGG